MYRPIVCLLALVPTAVFADETRELDSHEHGVGELNLAIDGNTLAMELHAPGADIVGFEYMAESAEDKAKVEAAVAVLKEPQSLFVLPDAAGCAVVDVHASLEEEDHHDDDHSGHDEEHDHDDDHDKDGEEHGHDDEPDEHDDHEHGADHSEFHAEYSFTCENPEALTKITFDYFETFENALELEVQAIGPNGAQAFEVERANPELDLSGL